jgi:hypothetical protein
MELKDPFRCSLGEAEAARVLALSVSTLRSWRSQGRGPVYSRLGRRIVYSREGLDRFLRENEVEVRRV